MAVKIRLKRMGKIRAPFYRVVVMDSRAKRDGRAIEEIGKYHPTEEPSLIDIDSERALHWLGLGAQPTEAVEALLKVTGDWQKHQGTEGTEGTLRVKAPKTSKKELYEAAMAAAGSSLETKDGATTPKKRATKAAAPKADKKDQAEDAKADKVEQAPAEAKVEETPAKADKVEATPAKADKVEETPAEAKVEEAPATEATVETKAAEATTEAGSDDTEAGS